MAPFNEQPWLAWLVKARIIIITFVLGIELALVNFTTAAVSKRLFVSTVIVWFTVALFYVVLLKLWDDAGLQARLQVVTDLGFATVILYATGGIDTSFNFLYPLIIIIAAIILPRYWAYLTASMSFILFGAVLEAVFFGVLPSSGTTRPDLKSLQATILVNLFAYLAIAYLASQLAAKLRRVNVQLQEKSGALQDLQALHENIVHSMSSGVITTDMNGCITVVNPAGARLLECVPGELAGRPIASLFEGEIPDEARRIETRYRTPSGQARTFGITASPLTMPERGRIGCIYSFTDLTEVRRLQREVDLRDRMAAVGRMASAIAHEIRNPLSSIAGSAQMLNESAGRDEDERVLLDIIRRESERLNHIISDFLAYSREKQYRFAPADLISLLEDTLKLLENRPECQAAEHPVHLVRDFAVTQALAEVDGDRIKQVFWNLCENALRAMPEGGTLRVAVRPAGSNWHISVTDNGTGMRQQALDNIFEPFHSEFSKGTGLGLAIVYQIVQAHEGRIAVQSAPGKGTEFTLLLKRATPAQASVAGAS